jgi:hypothetical protein
VILVTFLQEEGRRKREEGRGKREEGRGFKAVT